MSKAMSYRVWLPAVVVALIVLFLTRGSAAAPLLAIAAGLVAAGLLLRDRDYARSCPYCRGRLRDGATACGRCGRAV